MDFEILKWLFVGLGKKCYLEKLRFTQAHDTDYCLINLK